MGARCPPLRRLREARPATWRSAPARSTAASTPSTTPRRSFPAGRPLKTSPLYDRLRAKGAVFGARFGWERPLWFAHAGRGARRVLVPARELARGGRRRVPRRPVGRRRARPDELREVRALGAGRRGLPRPPLREPAARAHRSNRPDADVHAARRHRVRRHGDAARARTASTSCPRPRPSATTTSGSRATCPTTAASASTTSRAATAC